MYGDLGEHVTTAAILMRDMLLRPGSCCRGFGWLLSRRTVSAWLYQATVLL
jgi:hypothetical protein